jgi:hypothetical protein
MHADGPQAMFQSGQAALPWSRVICVHLHASVAEDSFTVSAAVGNAGLLSVTINEN